MGDRGCRGEKIIAARRLRFLAAPGASLLLVGDGGELGESPLQGSAPLIEALQMSVAAPLDVGVKEPQRFQIVDLRSRRDSRRRP